MAISKPIPVFDTLEQVCQLHQQSYLGDAKTVLAQWLDYCADQKVTIPPFGYDDFKYALSFLYSYRGSPDTFNAYRRELERLLQWSWFIKKQSICTHGREDIEKMIEFCQAPNLAWIGTKKVARFKLKDGIKQINPDWRPFVVTISKQAHGQGEKPDKSRYQFSQQALKVLFAILSSFYNFLVQEQAIKSNPVMLIRQKSKFIRKESVSAPIRRLTASQWLQVIDWAKRQAVNDKSYRRTVFILSCLYGMYLRISELVSNNRWTPTMGDFSQDNDGNWWFQVVGKGNKLRQIAVSPAMLDALKEYRQQYLQLSAYPLINETIPLIGHLKNPQLPITSTRPIRRLVQTCFDAAADELEHGGQQLEAEQLRVATVHWLRHTGISDDVKHRPREHVRDDAGHSSSAITDKYIDVELKERAKSAESKTII